MISEYSLIENKRMIYENNKYSSMIWLLIVASFIFIAFFIKDIYLIQLSLIVASFYIIVNPIYIGMPLYWIFAFSTQYYVYSNYSAARILGIALIFGLLIKVFIENINIMKSKYLVLVAVIALYTGASVLWSYDSTNAYSDYLSLLINLIIIILFFINSINTVTLNSLIYVATLISVFFILIMIIDSGNLYEGIISGSIDRISMDEMQNPGEFGRNLVIYFGCLLFFMKYKSSLYWLLNILSVAVCGILIVVSGSRSSIAGLVVIVLLNLILANRKRKVSYKILVTMTVFFIAVMLFLYSSEEVLDKILNRYTIESIVTSQGSRRFVLWELYSQHVIPENVIFGVGIGGSSEIAALASTNEVLSIYLKPAHNMYLQLFIQLGIVGFLMFISLYLNIIVDYFRSKKEDRITKELYFYIFIALLVMAVGEPMFFSKTFWIVLMLLIHPDESEKEGLIYADT